MRWMMTEDEILINLDHVTTIAIARRQGLDEVIPTIEATVMGRPDRYVVVHLPEDAPEDLCIVALTDVRDNLLYSNSSYIDYSCDGDESVSLNKLINSIAAHERRVAQDARAEALGL